MDTVFYCANSIDKHFVSQPIPLSCGHSICKRCLSTDSDNYEIRCKLCGELNKIDLNVEINETKLAKYAFQGNIDELFELLEIQMKESINTLKGI